MNKSGLDKHNRGTDFLNRIEKYSDLVSLEDALFAVGVAVQEAHQRGVSDTLGKVREMIIIEYQKFMSMNTSRSEKANGGGEVTSNLLSALDHLEEEK